MRRQRWSALIKAPPEEVFGLYVDPDRREEWNPSARDVQVVGELNQPGNRYLARTRFGTFEVEMLRVEAPHLVEILEGMQGRSKVRVTMHFDAVPGGTRLGVETVFDHQGRLSWLTEWAAALLGRVYNRIELRRFRRAAEHPMTSREPAS
jgi:uncharacterized protein YndB with AHSA1/START domain